LILHGVPLPIADRQAVHELLRQIIGTVGPAQPALRGNHMELRFRWMIHWTAFVTGSILTQSFLPSPMGTFSQRPSRRQRGAGVLHPMASVLNLAVRRVPAAESSAPMRRRRQRLALVQRLLDPLPAGLQPPEAQAERFWRIVRWGGLGVLLAWVLHR
jgi:hypothetical protein